MQGAKTGYCLCWRSAAASTGGQVGKDFSFAMVKQ
jgi:hypothetical protein